MALGLLGEKLGMTQWFDDDGKAFAATVVRVEPNTVVQVKSPERDGYSALQLAVRPTKERRVTKPLRGHFKRAGVGAHKVLREFPFAEAGGYKLGQQLSVALFEPGEYVDVRGRSKGRGTTGAMKRHGFAGGKASHGHSEAFRKLLSIGNMMSTGKVFKGKKMHGRHGDAKVTVENLRVLKVDPENGLIVLKGAVPGAKFGVLELIKHG